MIQPQALRKMFGYTATLVNKHASDISHEESLIQPENLPNSLNWLLGHLISARTRALQMIGEEPVWTDDMRARYRAGSAPITGDEAGVMAFGALVAAYNETHGRLLNGLQRLTYENLNELSGFETNTVADSLAYFQFHEAYHVGQIADVATALGKPSAWI